MIFFSFTKKRISFGNMTPSDRVTFEKVYTECVTLLPEDVWSEQYGLMISLADNVAQSHMDSEYKTRILQLSLYCESGFNSKSEWELIFKQFTESIFKFGDLDMEFGKYHIEEMAVSMYDITIDNDIEPLSTLAKKLLELANINEDKLLEAAENGEDWRVSQ